LLDALADGHPDFAAAVETGYANIGNRTTDLILEAINAERVILKRYHASQRLVSILAACGYRKGVSYMLEGAKSEIVEGIFGSMFFHDIFRDHPERATQGMLRRPLV